MKAQRLFIVLGDQLFPGIVEDARLNTQSHVWMAEDVGLCTHFKYHKHKLILFLSAMRTHAAFLRKHCQVHYSALDDQTRQQPYLQRLGNWLDEHPDISVIGSYEVEDQFFAHRLQEFCASRGLRREILPSPGFLCSRELFESYNQSVSKPFMASFYQQQRQRLNILLDEEGKALHGKWSFDADNRQKLPKDHRPALQPQHAWTQHTRDVIHIVDRYFADHPGDSNNFWLATTRQQALHHLDVFLRERLELFGPYEDAFEPGEPFIYHSTLSPYINLGLLTPAEVLESTLAFASSHEVHYPSLEGFVRQLIGWREFIRGIYHSYGEKMQGANQLLHRRKLSSEWWTGNTRIAPVDACIQRVNQYGYLHHIERLMVMGNMMLLSEIDPDEVYAWFMSLFVDSADWVMVPNVYGMSQFAEGGIFATKPYICGSNYWSKMSSYNRNAPWADIVDGLYWRFIDRKREMLLANPRSSMSVRSYDKMSPQKKATLHQAAESWLNRYTLMN